MLQEDALATTAPVVAVEEKVTVRWRWWAGSGCKCDALPRLTLRY